MDATNNKDVTLLLKIDLGGVRILSDNVWDRTSVCFSYWRIDGATRDCDNNIILCINCFSFVSHASIAFVFFFNNIIIYLGSFSIFL